MEAPAISRTNLVVGLTLVALLLALLYAIGSLWSLRQEFVGTIDQLKPRIARLNGITQSEEQLAAAAALIEESLLELAYPAEGDVATASANMQQRVRTLLSGAGLTVVGSQILPPVQQEGLQLLRLDVSAQGSVDGLEAALADIREVRPVVMIATLSVKPERRARADARAGDGEDVRTLSARLRLTSFRLLP
jgi:general secretion pathway protein M